MQGMHTQAPRNRLAELREEQGVTLREIGELCGGKYTSTVQRWEGKLIPQEHLGVIARRFGVSVAYLAGWSDERRQEQAA